jgi:hypothetical protein
MNELEILLGDAPLETASPALISSAEAAITPESLRALAGRHVPARFFERAKFLPSLSTPTPSAVVEITSTSAHWSFEEAAAPTLSPSKIRSFGPEIEFRRFPKLDPAAGSLSEVPREFVIRETHRVDPCESCKAQKRVRCEKCRGTGKTEAPAECSACHGTGRRSGGQCRACNGSGHSANVVQVQCSACEGLGTVQCSRCGGEGYFEKAVLARLCVNPMKEERSLTGLGPPLAASIPPHPPAWCCRRGERPPAPLPITVYVYRQLNEVARRHLATFNESLHRASEEFEKTAAKWTKGYQPPVLGIIWGAEARVWETYRVDLVWEAESETSSHKVAKWMGLSTPTKGIVAVIADELDQLRAGKFNSMIWKPALRLNFRGRLAFRDAEVSFPLGS